jgi:hypothetical protein
MKLKTLIISGLIGLTSSTILLAKEGNNFMPDPSPQKPQPKVEVRRGVVIYTDDTTEQHGRRFRERTIRRLEPTGIGKPEKINEYIEKYKTMAVFDPKVTCFEVEGKVESGNIMLSGRVSLPEYRDGLVSILTAMNLQNIKDEIVVLPDKKLGNKTFAIASTTGVPFYSRTTGLKEQLTESILGETIYLLAEDSAGNYYYAQSGSGYLGWIEKKNVISMTQSAFHKWQQKPRVVFLKEYNIRKIKIPIGTILPITDKQQIVLPDGQKIAVANDYFRIVSQTDQFGKKIIATAKQFLGTPYVWGGNTKAGIDCSGFVQIVFRANGINLARDADEQAINGQLIGFRGYTEDMLPGDTLYFAGHNGRITHTGIYLGNNEFIHATDPHVMISSLDPQAKNYSEKHAKGFVLARRIIRE